MADDLASYSSCERRLCSQAAKGIALLAEWDGLIDGYNKREVDESGASVGKDMEKCGDNCG